MVARIGSIDWPTATRICVSGTGACESRNRNKPASGITNAAAAIGAPKPPSRASQIAAATAAIAKPCAAT
ncbi:MAG: hypothetical protein IPK74_11025 [Deltaproteobacteria bacterium]|nr:hypothetical protein [Deltaproteobacteria bacterium]